ncbi:ovotransferrin-like [Oculina patagonica]
MASALESLFHEAIEFSLEKQGTPERDLKKEQYDAIRAIGRHGHAAYPMRWCTTSAAEQKKCIDFIPELKKIANDSTPSCVQAANAIECMKKIQNGDADLITLDGGEIYKAGKKYEMVPVVAEDYGYGTISYYAVAVVKKSNSDIDISKLKGKKTCHTGAGKTAGWIVPIGTLLSKGYMKQDSSCNPYISAGKYFKESCVPNVQLSAYDPKGNNPENLCALCPSECKKEGNYSGYSGAFKCMDDDVGEVAFVKHTTVKDTAKKAVTNYQYLCKDGKRGGTY